MTRTNAHCVIRMLSEIFGIFGYAKECVCDNGPPFGSYDFKQFLESHDIKLTHSPPYHPQSNGIVERAVQTTKSVLRKFVNEYLDSFQIDRAIEKFLFSYRNTPHTENQIVPSHKMFTFQPRWIMPILNSSTVKKAVSFKKVQETRKVEVPKKEKDLEKKIVKLEFKNNEDVLYLSSLKGYCHATKAKVVKKLSTFVYLISVEGIIKKAHINQLRKSILRKTISRFVEPFELETVEKKPEIDSRKRKRKDSSSSDQFETASEEEHEELPKSVATPLRRSRRERKNTSFFAPK